MQREVECGSAYAFEKKGGITAVTGVTLLGPWLA